MVPFMPLLTTTEQTDEAQRRPDSEQDQQIAPAVGIARLRVLFSAAVGPLITAYLAVAALLALLTATATAAQFSTTGVLAAAGPGWLATYQVPLEITGQPLGVLPLLATVGACFLVARTASGATQRMGCRQPHELLSVVGIMAGAHALFGLIIALVANGREVHANPWLAMAVPGLLAGASAFAGVSKRCPAMKRARDYLDPIALRGLRGGVLGVSALLACGALVFLVSMVTSLPTAQEIFTRGAPGLGSGLGMLLLSLGYLPNALVFALSFAAGPGFSIGSMSLVPYGLTGGPVPGVPLLAGLPQEQAAWWPFLMALPAAAGLLVGWSLRQSHEKPFTRLRAVFVAGALVGFVCVIIGTFAGGRLGSGVFNPVSIPVGPFSVAAFFWIVVPGGLVAWFAGPRAIPREPVVDIDGGPDTETMPAIEDDYDEDGHDYAEDAEEVSEEDSDLDDSDVNDGESLPSEFEDEEENASADSSEGTSEDVELVEEFASDEQYADEPNEDPPALSAENTAENDENVDEELAAEVEESFSAPDFSVPDNLSAHLPDNTPDNTPGNAEDLAEAQEKPAEEFPNQSKDLSGEDERSTEKKDS
jgi:hypothetical protein